MGGPSLSLTDENLSGTIFRDRDQHARLSLVFTARFIEQHDATTRPKNAQPSNVLEQKWHAAYGEPVKFGVATRHVGRNVYVALVTYKDPRIFKREILVEHIVRLTFEDQAESA